MLKIFAAAAAILGFVTFSVASAAEFYADWDVPGQADRDDHAARSAVVHDVIDGRLSLVEAATAFRDLNRQAPAVAEGLAAYFPGQTEGGRACQQLLLRVRDELKDSGEGSVEPANVVLPRLEADLEAARGSDGKVRLPGDAD